jgi:hypothetical protein
MDGDLPQPIRSASARQIRASMLRQFLARSQPGTENHFALQTRPRNLGNQPLGCGCRDSKPLVLGLAFSSAPAPGGLWYKTGPEPPNQRAPRLQAHTHKGKFLRGQPDGTAALPIPMSSFARTSWCVLSSHLLMFLGRCCGVSTNPASHRALCGL